jgi:hypothetical protein
VWLNTGPFLFAEARVIGDMYLDSLEVEKEPNIVTRMRQPPRSPDIVPVDLFLWVYVKEIWCASRVNDSPSLEADQ